MSANYMLRDQFKKMHHSGTPPLQQIEKRQRISDINRWGFSVISPDPKFKEVKYQNLSKQSRDLI